MTLKDNMLPLKIFLAINEGCGGRSLILECHNLNPVPIVLILWPQTSHITSPYLFLIFKTITFITFIYFTRFLSYSVLKEWKQLNYKNEMGTKIHWSLIIPQILHFLPMLMLKIIPGKEKPSLKVKGKGEKSNSFSSDSMRNFC